MRLQYFRCRAPLGHRVSFFRAEELQANVQLLPGADADCSVQVVRIDNCQGHVTENPHSSVAPHGKVRVFSAREDPRFHVAVIEPRHYGHIELHAAADTFDDPDELAARPGADRGIVGELRRELATAVQRAWIRRVVWCVLLVLITAGLVTLWRDAGSVRAALRRLVRPPIEVALLAPLAAVLGLVAWRGNPLAARAITVSWWSPSTLCSSCIRRANRRAGLPATGCRASAA